ncbi:serine protease [Luedemannella helvata]|uniref:Serine protease n=1 Tax=Luedemannella helvata TaxID=349315 RepID=A0ABN2KXX1_9ACTN
MTIARPQHEEDLPFYSRFGPCLVALETADVAGNIAIGTAFHLGDGILVTARHVVENRTITAAVSHRYAKLSLESIEVILSGAPDIDLALLKTDFSLEHYMSDRLTIHLGVNTVARKIDHIEIGGHLDDWINDSLVLMPVVLMGFPPIPTSSEPVLVAARGEVNAIIDSYLGPQHPLFVISPISRGGFSGGPVLTDSGWLLGVMVQSLVTDHAPPELGFGVALTIEPLLSLLHANDLYPGSNAELMRELGFGPEEYEAPS